MRCLTPFAIVTCLLTLCQAQPKTAPATQPQWQITITGIEGINQGRIAPDQPWMTLAVGMKFTRGSEIRNGVRSAVRLTVPAGQVITLDRLGIYRIDPEMIEMNPTTGLMTMAPTSSTLRVYIGPPQRNGVYYVPPVPPVTTRPKNVP